MGGAVNGYRVYKFRCIPPQTVDELPPFFLSVGAPKRNQQRRGLTSEWGFPHSMGKFHNQALLFQCHFDRREKSSAKHCPEQREGSVRHRKILRPAQNDLPWQVRFLATLEMTLGLTQASTRNAIYRIKPFACPRSSGG